jgi:hypothetical protein
MAQSGFRNLQIDAGKVVGEIHSFQGMNGMPSPVIAGFPRLVRQFREMRVDQVRTHDVMGPTDIDAKFSFKNSNLAWLIPDPAVRAGVVKAGNAAIIFPNENADPEMPASYVFGPTDKMLADVQASGAAVYYRIGRSWGANTNPPADFDRFANVVKHIAMHYNQGWAKGFHYNIRYWEFWNEPEGFWTGTPEDFFRLYEKTALALKSVDPKLKVGGDGLAGAYNAGPYREGFLDYCASHKVPLDFYSWHTYADLSADAYDGVRLAVIMRALLDAHGFPKAESILSEWNLSADFTAPEEPELHGMHNAAYVGAVLSYLQDAPLDHAMFYRADAAWVGLVDMQGRYFKPAYTFKAMGKMLDAPRRFAVEGTDTFGFAALAGRSADGKTVQVFISNYAIPAGYKRAFQEMPAELKGPDTMNYGDLKTIPLRTDVVYRDNAGYSLAINNLPWGKGTYTLKRYRISGMQNLELVESQTGSGGSLRLSNPMPVDTVELIVLRQK